MSLKFLAAAEIKSLKINLFVELLKRRSPLRKLLEIEDSKLKFSAEPFQKDFNNLSPEAFAEVNKTFISQNLCTLIQASAKQFPSPN